MIFTRTRNFLYSDRIRLFILNMLILAVFVRTSIPFSRFFFYPVVLTAFLYSAINFRFGFRRIVIALKSLQIVIILGVVYFLSFIATSNISVDLLKEGFNVINVLVIAFVLVISIRNSDELESLIVSWMKIVIYLSFLASFAGIIKFLLEIKGINLPLFNDHQYPFGSSLIPDYNFFSLVSLIGIVFILYNIIREKIVLNSLFQQVALFTLSLNVIFTGSRRSDIALLTIIAAIILFLLFRKLYGLFYSGKKLPEKIMLSLLKYLAALSVFIVLISTLPLHIRPETKISATRTLGLKLSKCQYYSTSILFKIRSILKLENYTDLYSKLWCGSFDPLNPYSGWGNGDYALFNDFDSLGLKGILGNASGIMLDHNTNSYYFRENSYYSTLIKRINLVGHLRYKAKIYCYVSPDYDGGQVTLRVTPSGSKIKYAPYDLSRKGSWQQLTLNFFGEEGPAEFDANFQVNKKPDLSSLSGFVVFACPTIDSLALNPDEPDTWADIPFKEVFPLTGKNVEIVPVNSRGCLLDKNSIYYKESSSSEYAYSFLTFGNFSIRKGDKIVVNVYAYVSPDYNGNVVMLMTENGKLSSVYDLSDTGVWKKLKLEISGNDSKTPVFMYHAKYGVTDLKTLNGYIIFAHPTYEMISGDSASKRPVSGIPVNQNINYAGLFPFANGNIPGFRENGKIFSNQLTGAVNSEQQNMMDVFSYPRIRYWKYGWHIYREEYGIRQKILMGGFDYMNKFGGEFLMDPDKIDWPHNPFISVLLYSGILGLILYIVLLLRTLYLYYIYLKEYWHLFGCFLISFFFSFFSANNPFDPVISGFFVILPFVLHSVYVRMPHMAEQ